MLCILRLVAKLVFFDEIALQLRVQKKATTEKRLSLCRDDKIRTCDPRDPNTVRYQTALHPDDIRFSNVSHFQKCAATSHETIHRIVSLGRVLHPDILCFALAFLLYHLKKKL